MAVLNNCKIGVFAVDSEVFTKKLSGLTNILAGNPNSYAVKKNHLEVRQLEELGSRETELFILHSLQRGLPVLVYNRMSYFAYDLNVDILALQLKGNRLTVTGIQASEEREAFRINIIEGDFDSLDGICGEIQEYIESPCDCPSDCYFAFALDAKQRLIYAPTTHDFENTMPHPSEWRPVTAISWADKKIDNSPKVTETINSEGNLISATITENPKQENDKMSNVKTNAVAVLTKNKNAATNVAKLEAGRIAIKQVSKLVTPKLPMMVRGYADTPVGRLVIANIFSMAVAQFASTNKNAVLVADAMMDGAMLEAIQSLNFEQMINDVVDKVDITKFVE